MQNADGNHENGDYESDLEFDAWEEDFVDDPEENDTTEGEEAAHAILPQDTALSADSDTEQQAPAKSKKNTSRNIAILLILLAAGGGGTYFYLNQNASTVTTPVVRLDENINTTPPAPTEDDIQNADMASNVSTTDIQVTESIDNPIPTPAASQDNTVLTPFPEDIEDSSVELVPLDAPIENIANLSDDMPADVQTIEEGMGEIPPIASPEEIAEKSLALEEDSLLSKTEETPLAMPQETPSENILEDEVSQEIIPDVAEKAPEAPIDSLENAAVSEPIEDVSSIQETKKVQPTEEKSTKQAVKTPAAEIVLPQWEIRGANPQSAVLYDKKSGETRTVEVGNTVKGLGKIKKIAKENGLWVVTGTQNKVKQ